MFADASVKIWHPSTGTLLRTCTGHGRGVLSLLWHRVLPAASPREPLPSNIASQAAARSANAAGVLPDVNRKLVLISGAQDGTLRCWDVAAGMCLQELSIHSRPIVALRACGRNLVSVAGAAAFSCAHLSGCAQQHLHMMHA